MLGTIEVVNRGFTDERPVTLHAFPAEPTILTSPASGRITATTCRKDSTITSGSAPFSVNGRAIVALKTAVPLWRELAVGDSGSDVRALQEELQRLGFSVAADGTLGNTGIGAVNTLRGAPEDDTSSLLAADVLWIPDVTNQVLECSGELGRFVAAGDPLATLRSGDGSAAVVDSPSNLIPGPRALRIGEVSAPVSDDGRVTDEKLLRAISEAAGAVDPDASGARAVVAASLLLEPVTVGVVPASALVAIEGDRACVVGPDGPAQVRLVSSQLGETYVLPSLHGELPARVEIQPDQTTTCG
ncbi:peptidoglycan-binding domain-containing protein [Agromyces allii]|nr:hypothetical protein [Agromyces allii]